MRLDRINSKALPQSIIEWKRSAKTKSCFNKLFQSIDPDNSEETFFNRILVRSFQATVPTNYQLAFAVTVCQILLHEHYEKLNISDNIMKNRLNKNIVSIL